MNRSFALDAAALALLAAIVLIVLALTGLVRARTCAASENVQPLAAGR